MSEKLNKRNGEINFWPSDNLVSIFEDYISDLFDPDWPLTEEELRKQMEEAYKDEKDVDVDEMISGFKGYFGWKEYTKDELKELMKKGISEDFMDFLFVVAEDKWKEDLDELSIATKDDFFLCYKDSILFWLYLEDFNKKNHEVVKDFFKDFLKELFEFAATPRKYNFGTLKVKDKKIMFEIDQEFMIKRDKVPDLDNVSDDKWTELD